jgi:hypothetical protein
VVDVQHKPRGLTSLSRYHLSQVHKVQHKPRKKFSWEHNRIWSKTWECAAKWRTGHCPVHQALDQTNQPLPRIRRARSGIIHRTVRCAPDMSGEPTEQRLSARQRSTTKVNSDEQCATEVRAAKSEVIGHVRCATGLSSAAKGQRVPTVNSSKP